jgi:DNA transformation protein
MMMSDSFVDFVEDQLRNLPDVRSRAMFGGHGLYQGNVFFGIVHKGRLYFKTNPDTAKPYVERGMKPFRPGPRQSLKRYYEVPVDVIEDDGKLVSWARAAIKSG